MMVSRRMGIGRGDRIVNPSHSGVSAWRFSAAAKKAKTRSRGTGSQTSVWSCISSLDASARARRCISGAPGRAGRHCERWPASSPSVRGASDKIGRPWTIPTSPRRRRAPLSTSSAQSSTTTSPPGSTRALRPGFRPEPNGYLHIGHAKSICLNFGVAAERGGTCNLRFDDTNPTKEDVEYVDAIKEDVAWLGFTWDALLYRVGLLRAALPVRRELIRRGKAYVDSLTRRRDPQLPRHADRAGPEQPVSRPAGRREPRSVRAHAGRRVRGRRARAAREDRHGVAQPQHARPDALPHPPRALITAPATRGASTRCTTSRTRCPTRSSGITHSLCTLEFEDHRPLYDWLVEQLFDGDRPQQIEFARLNLNYTVMSKRKLLQLVQQGHVAGLGRSADADDQRPAPPRLHAGVDPRLLRAHRRRQEGERHRRRAARAQRPRGPQPPRAARHGGAAAAQGRDHELPGGAGRGGRRRSTIRRIASAGTRKVPFSRELYIERDDFREDPPKKFFRLSPGQGSAAALRLLHHLSRRS